MHIAMGINSVARYGLLCLAAFSTAVSAATSTEDDTSATCVSATAAASTATWAIDYTAADAPTTGTGYDIDSAFEAAYAFNSTMSVSTTHSANVSDYVSFKCQYACNGNKGCVSFFGRFVDVDTDQEHFECISFTALLDDSAFTTSTSNIANGGYNRLCS